MPRLRSLKAKATPTEIYSDICAELVAKGQVRPPTVHIFGHGRPTDALADAMDDLGKSWLPPGRVVIHADLPAPGELGEGMQWVGPGDAWPAAPRKEEWVVLLEAGTRLEPYSLIELLAAARRHPGAQMVYAAHDVALAPAGRCRNSPAAPTWNGCAAPTTWAAWRPCAPPHGGRCPATAAMPVPTARRCA